MKKLVIMTIAAVLIAACSGGGGGGQRLTETYEGYSVSGRIANYPRSEIQIRQVELINAIRSESGAQPLVLDAQLTAAAMTHARDIAAQQRAWNYGSDKSTPFSRAQRAGFNGTVTGENVSETFRGETAVMQSWLNDPMARAVITDPSATHVGIGWYMDPSGKVWWVEDFGVLGVSPSDF